MEGQIPYQGDSIADYDLNVAVPEKNVTPALKGFNCVAEGF